jgi:hypothetical protein
VRAMEVGGESAGAAGIRSLAHCEEPATAPGLARQHEEPGLLELPHASTALIGRLWAVGTPRLPDAVTGGMASCAPQLRPTPSGRPPKQRCGP